MDIESYIDRLVISNPLREQTVRAMVRALNLPGGSYGLDAGCGIGLQAKLLADEVGPDTTVTGVDLSSEMLDYGRDIVRKDSLSPRVSLCQGDVNRLPFADATFDWVWSADCVGYSPGESLEAFQELARVLKPGGTLAIAVFSSQKLLPGYPLLEARLEATPAGLAPFAPEKNPSMHFLRALGWFHKLGFDKPGASTFAGSFHAPLSDEIRNALISLIDMRWPDVSGELSPDEWQEFQRLCLPESPDFILNLPDYYAFFTYTLFQGKRAG